MNRPLHALTFDVEEYFQVANLSHRFPRQDWDAIPSRLSIGMEAILGCLAARNVRATFFFLGWIAERHPEWVVRCLEGGHEVASHGYDHRFLGEFDAASFDRDLERTERALTSAGAPRPVGFRASTFTLTRETWWAFEVLARRGYRYDSSIHPIRHPTYGIADFEPGVSRVESSAGALWEFPVATFPCLWWNLPVGGGGYFRLIPGGILRALLGSLERRARPIATYLHPWEFDPEQPRIEAPALNRFRHYVGLGKTLHRLERLLDRFHFGTMANALEEAGHGIAPPA